MIYFSKSEKIPCFIYHVMTKPPMQKNYLLWKTFWNSLYQTKTITIYGRNIKYRMYITNPF